MQSSKWSLSRLFLNSKKFVIYIIFKTFIDFLITVVKQEFIIKIVKCFRSLESMIPYRR